MSNNPFSARRGLSRGTESCADDRRGRHLELVTERWIAELAEPVVLRPRASGAGAPATLTPMRDRDPRIERPDVAQ